MSTALVLGRVGAVHLVKGCVQSVWLEATKIWESTARPPPLRLRGADSSFGRHVVRTTPASRSFSSPFSLDVVGLCRVEWCLRRHYVSRCRVSLVVANPRYHACSRTTLSPTGGVTEVGVKI